MQKVYKTISAVAGRVLFIGFSIQIILGICWMICNFTGFQKFGESILYEEISKTLICDEYEGILYPVLIMITKGMEELILVPYRFILYLLQIGFAFFASFKLLDSVGVKGKLWKSWGALAMLTFPMAMQCHLAVLPDSFVGSLLVLEIAVTTGILMSGQRLTSGGFVKGLTCWVLAAFMQPEYLYIGAIPVLILFLYGLVKAWKNDSKRILCNAVLLAAFWGMVLIVSDLTQAEGYYGRVSKSLNASMVSRLAWSYAEADYGYWPEELKQHFTWNDALQIDHYADNIDLVLGRTLETAVGEKRAGELLGEIARIAWQNHKGEILYRTAWDAVGYTFSPMVLQRQFTGKIYDSYSGRNYDIMRAETPYLTKYYMDYSCWWFVAGLVLTAITQFLSFGNCLVKNRKQKLSLPWNGRGVLVVVNVLFTSGMLVLLYTLRGAGMMDYKKSIAVTLLWIWWMLFACVKGMRAEK